MCLVTLSHQDHQEIDDQRQTEVARISRSVFGARDFDSRENPSRRRRGQARHHRAERFAPASQSGRSYREYWSLPAAITGGNPAFQRS